MLTARPCHPCPRMVYRASYPNSHIPDCFLNALYTVIVPFHESLFGKKWTVFRQTAIIDGPWTANRWMYFSSHMQDWTVTVFGCGLERITFKAVCDDAVSVFSLCSPVCVNQTLSHIAIQVENTHPRFWVKWYRHDILEVQSYLCETAFEFLPVVPVTIAMTPFSVLYVYWCYRGLLFILIIMKIIVIVISIIIISWTVSQGEYLNVS